MEGYKVLNVYCSERFYVAFILAEKDGKKYMLSAGNEPPVLGQSEENAVTQSFKPLKLPENTFFVDIQC